MVLCSANGLFIARNFQYDTLELPRSLLRSMIQVYMVPRRCTSLRWRARSTRTQPRSGILRRMPLSGETSCTFPTPREPSMSPMLVSCRLYHLLPPDAQGIPGLCAPASFCKCLLLSERKEVSASATFMMIPQCYQGCKLHVGAVP